MSSRSTSQEFGDQTLFHDHFNSQKQKMQYSIRTLVSFVVALQSQEGSCMTQIEQHISRMVPQSYLPSWMVLQIIFRMVLSRMVCSNHVFPIISQNFLYFLNDFIESPNFQMRSLGNKKPHRSPQRRHRCSSWSAKCHCRPLLQTARLALYPSALARGTS